MTQESLRAAIGMVTQDTSLLHRSVLENIPLRTARRRYEAAIEGGKVRACARVHPLVWRTKMAARADQARVGERGVKLPEASANASPLPACCSSVRGS